MTTKGLVGWFSKRTGFISYAGYFRWLSDDTVGPCERLQEQEIRGSGQILAQQFGHAP